MTKNFIEEYMKEYNVSIDLLSKKTGLSKDILIKIKQNVFLPRHIEQTLISDALHCMPFDLWRKNI